MICRYSANPGNNERRETLSVVIPTKNAANLLAECVASVLFADEIVVVDMHSGDHTRAVCAQVSQCRLIERDDYIFGNVNYGFEQARGDWIMRLDTDERITVELAAEIQEILTGTYSDITGFEFWERPVILGRELQHGFGRHHYRKMMFRRGTARYPVKSEHESLETSGKWTRCREGYLHFNYTTVGQYLRKMDYYTDRDVERAVLSDTRPRVRAGVIETARAFYLYYLKYLGYRDGWVGLVDAGMRGIYQFVYWAKLRERWQREKEEVYGISR